MCYDLHFIYDCLHLKSITGQEVYCERFVRKDQPCKNRKGNLRRHCEPVSDGRDSKRKFCPSCEKGDTNPLKSEDAETRIDYYGEWARYSEALEAERRARQEVRRLEALEAAAQDSKRYDSRHAGLKGGETRTYEPMDNLDGKFESDETRNMDLDNHKGLGDSKETRKALALAEQTKGASITASKRNQTTEQTNVFTVTTAEPEEGHVESHPEDDESSSDIVESVEKETEGAQQVTADATRSTEFFEFNSRRVEMDATD